MTTNIMTKIKFSPVDIEARRNLDIRPGDTVKVWQRIQEGEKTRLQAFEGLVIARKHGREPGATFTVRKISGGVGVERIFPLYAPFIEKIDLLKRSKVRRAKLNYVRKKAAKEIRRKMRQASFERKQILVSEKASSKKEEADEKAGEGEKKDNAKE